MRARLHPLSIALSVALLPLASAAQVRTDASLGQAARTLAGPTYAITESLGRRAGNNLFHSFQTFRIGSGETALFTTTTPTIANVIGRVTGGEVSTIDGTLRLQAAAGAPALFLINPAGVVFGPGAAIDVPGAFHVSTADAIRFPDGAFHADPARASTFSAAPPEAFGFLGAQRAAVVLRGATLGTRDAPVSIVAGDVTLGYGATIDNAAGAVNVAAVGRQAADVPIQGEPGALSGTIRIEAGSSITTTAGGAGASGPIRLAGGTLELQNVGAPAAGVSTFSDSGRSGDLRVAIAGDARIAAGRLSTGTFLGTSGALQLTAGNLEVGADGSIQSEGGMGISARSITVTGGGIFSDGRSGTVDLQADTLRVADGGRIFLDSLQPRSIRAREVLLDGGQVRSWNSFRADSGALAIEASERVEMINDSVISVEKSEAGRSGPLVLNTPRLVMDRSTIRSETDGSGAGGELRISVAGSAELRNGSFISSTSFDVDAGAANGDIALRAGELILRDSSIVSDNYAQGVRAGDVRLDVEGRLLLANSGDGSTGIINTHDGGRTRRGGQGPSGQISVRAGELVVDGASDMSSTRIATVSNEGAAGGVDIEVRGGVLLRRATIQTEAPADADGGAIRVRAGGTVRVEDSSIDTSSRGAGRAGDITVEGAAIQLAAGPGDTPDEQPWYARIESDGLDTGDAGNVLLRASGGVSLDGFTSVRATGQRHSNSGRVEVQAASLALTGSDAGRAEINTTTYGSGRGGDLLLRISGPIELRYGGRLTSDTLGSGNAGSVTIDAQSLLVRNDGSSQSTRVGSSSFAQPQGGGNAGSITVRLAGDLQLRGGGFITTQAGSGDAGVIRIEAANVLVEGASVEGAAVRRSSITAFAEDAASGQLGTVSVDAAQSIVVRDGARISMLNSASSATPQGITRGVLRLSAARVTVAGATIDAASTGNVAASDIDVHATGMLNLDNGRITTSATGSAGDGGNIRVTAPAMALKTGFVQANATAGGATGGDIALDVQALVASYQSLRVGGDTIAAFEAGRAGANVIQAVAPTGVSGNILIASPQVDVAGSLAQVKATGLANTALGKTPCHRSGGSSLALAGRGGLPPSAAGPAGAQQAAAATRAVVSVVRVASQAGCPGS